MISKSLQAISTYLWHQSTKRINSLIINDDNFNISDYYYLIVINNMENPNFGDVASALHLTKPAVSALIKRLLHHELIEKVQSNEDKRVFYLSITQKGKEIIEEDPAIYQQLENVIADRISPEQLHHFDELLKMVNEILYSENN